MPDADATARKRVPVVNDTEEIVELFRDILEGMGHQAWLRWRPW
jgi:hypothetical protein